MERQAHRILHIADSPNDSRLLGEQLRHCGIDSRLQRAGSLLALRAAMREPPALVVADLPLPWAEADLLAIRVTHPRLPVLFRFGHPGNWHVDDPCLQIGRAVAKALGIDPAAPQPATADQQAHVRMQRTLLQLGRLDYRDFAASLRSATESIAEVFAIERVSVWELGEDDTLHCLDLFTASQRTHLAGTNLVGITKYRRLLDEEVTIATPDATKDDRFTEFNGWYLQAHRITSVLDTPIRTNGRVAGVLCVEHVGQPRSWSMVDMDGAAAMAHLIGGGLSTRDRHTAEANLERARKSETLGRIAAQLAHDFNNRLTVITLLVDQIAQEATTPTQIEATKALAEELVRARDKVRTMLAGRIADATAADTTDLAALLRQEQPNLQRIVAPHSLECALDPRPVVVAMPTSDLREALTNLVTNARDAMPAAGGHCTIRLRAPADDKASFAELLVEDDGQGMSREVQEHLFEPFFTTKREGMGSGIGLASVQTSVQRAGGHVRVRTQPGKGTTVVLVLPLARTADEPRALSG
jgi:signal transduction histidine kinase